MPYSVKPPEPLPADGYRKLSMLESVRRAASFACAHARGMGVCQGRPRRFFDASNEPMTA